MPESPEPPPQIVQALETLRELRWLTKEGEPERRWTDRTWAFPCRFQVDTDSAGPVPQTTRWWVRLDEAYPDGAIDFLPAKDGGLELTFPHQARNDPGPEKEPWRRGKLCLHTNIDSLRRCGFRTEPRSAGKRLLWHAERARSWLIAASRNELTAPGEPFELPDFQPTGPTLGFSEDEESLRAWSATEARSGYLVTGWIHRTLLALRFTDSDGEVVHAPAWGVVEPQSTKGPSGAWVRLQKVPIQEPWEAPSSWEDLVAVCRAQDVDLEEEVLRLFDRKFRSTPKKHQRRPLLLGFSIPERFDGPPRRLHWVGFQLPPLTERGDPVRGFRPTPDSIRSQDRRKLHGMGSLPWFRSSCWSDDELTGRGRLSDALRRSSVLLVGAGALGSAIGEMLVRGGIRRIVVVDPQSLEAGNLLRHTLGLNDVSDNKAEALAKRLQQIAPEVDAQGLGYALAEVPERFHGELHAADLVLDATGGNSVLGALETLAWPGQRTFISLSVGFYCRQLYLFAARGQQFPRADFVRVLAPWLEEDGKEVDDRELPREGIGCWQPLWPGAAHEIMMLVGAATSIIDEMFSPEEPFAEPRFVVLEQVRDAGRFMGVSRHRGASSLSPEP